MWQTEIFATREEMNAWLEERDGEIQYNEIFVNNAYGVEWKPLRMIKFDDECDD